MQLEVVYKMLIIWRLFVNYLWVTYITHQLLLNKIH